MGNQAGMNGERPKKRERKGRTGEATVRRKREESGKETQRLSSRRRNRRGRKKPEGKRKSPKAKARGKHRWNGCGSETGKDERKQTESRVLKNGREARETGRNGSGKAGKPKGGEAAPEKQL